MSQDTNESDIVKQLRERIEALEIDQVRANQRIEELERITEESKNGSIAYSSSTVTQSNETGARRDRRASRNLVKCSKGTSGSKHTKARCPDIVRVDRRGDRLDIGDMVYIKTRGRNPERYGTITGFDGQWALILDRTNREQKRLPRNVELRDW